MDLNHHLCLMLLEEKLHLCPLPENRPLRILDTGTGTGIWAMDMADKYASSQIVCAASISFSYSLAHYLQIGNDLSPIQPKW
jgi:ubiquinone/menaquinone biosynthesis C-methylase UbiE